MKMDFPGQVGRTMAMVRVVVRSDFPGQVSRTMAGVKVGVEVDLSGQVGRTLAWVRVEIGHMVDSIDALVDFKSIAIHRCCYPSLFEELSAKYNDSQALKKYFCVMAPIHGTLDCLSLPFRRQPF